MDGASAAVGVASFGVQACQGLLSYYSDWKDYDADINSTYESIHDLSKTLALLKASLTDEELDDEKRERVKTCLQSCESQLTKLSERSQKLRTYSQPEGLRQKAWTELQKATYSFQAKTLGKVQALVNNVQERLKLAVQVLQLDASVNTQRLSKQIATNLDSTASRVAAIEMQADRIAAAQESEQFKKITDWLSPSDPWTNFEAARQRHEPETGIWLLQSDRYRKWKSTTGRCLWLYGKAGCGKTILCSTVVDDIREHCEHAPNSGFGIFFFSFLDDHKQSYDSLLRSLVFQLGQKEPGLSLLRRAYEQSKQKASGSQELENVLISSLEPFDEFFILLDALDECPDNDEARQSLLEGLEGLLRRATQLNLMATSRDLGDIRDYMEAMRSLAIPVETNAVDTDIQKWLSSQLAADRKLRKLSPAMKSLVQDTIAQKADGMFRWAYCQLHELKKLKSLKPKYIEHALGSLPATLDATYERMLASIGEIYCQEAICLLRWLAYAKSPLRPDELIEAAIVSPEGDGLVDLPNRGSLEDLLEILGALVTIEWSRDDANLRTLYSGSDVSHTDDEEGNGTGTDDMCEDDITPKEDRASRSGSRTFVCASVRLAHFSVQEYLESPRILQSQAAAFHLNKGEGHDFLAHSCLTYLIHYSRSHEKTSADVDEISFPLLPYAAGSWFHHSLLKASKTFDLEVQLLGSESIMRDWLRQNSTVDVLLQNGSTDHLQAASDRSGSCIYYASVLGLENVVRALLESGFDVNATGGYYGNALCAASAFGSLGLVQMLVENGADVNGPGEYYANALCAASIAGHLDIVNFLLGEGADLGASRAVSDALWIAYVQKHAKIVDVLLEKGANSYSEFSPSSAGLLSTAIQHGRPEFVKPLLRSFLAFSQAEALHGSRHQTKLAYGSAVLAAARSGHADILQTVLDIDPNDKPAEKVFEQLWPVPDPAPPCLPRLLQWEIAKLRKSFTDADVELNMHLYGVNLKTGAFTRASEPPSGEVPVGVKTVFLPEFRCRDCPGSPYVVMLHEYSVKDSDHLKSHEHRENVRRRNEARIVENVALE